MRARLSTTRAITARSPMTLTAAHRPARVVDGAGAFDYRSLAHEPDHERHQGACGGYGGKRQWRRRLSQNSHPVLRAGVAAGPQASKLGRVGELRLRPAARPDPSGHD